MSLERILDFTLDAAAFALPIGVLFLLYRWIGRKGPMNWRQEGKCALFVTYLAALLKITAIRQAGFTDLFIAHSLDSVQLMPLVYTVQELGNGLWAFIYPVVGNLIWFAPLGFFLRWLWEKISWRQTLAISTVLSLTIELAQWLLQTGVSDIDDMIFNSLGGVLGWWLFVAVFQKVCYAMSKRRSKEERV